MTGLSIGKRNLFFFFSEAIKAKHHRNVQSPAQDLPSEVRFIQILGDKIKGLFKDFPEIFVLFSRT